MFRCGRRRPPGSEIHPEAEGGCQCPAGHTLSPSAAPRGGIDCDLCKRSVDAGKELWTCGTCNYQICGNCRAARTSVDPWSLRHMAHTWAPSDAEASVLTATVTLAHTIESLSAEVTAARADAARSAERAANAEKALQVSEAEQAASGHAVDFGALEAQLARVQQASETRLHALEKQFEEMDARSTEMQARVQ